MVALPAASIKPDWSRLMSYMTSATKSGNGRKNVENGVRWTKTEYVRAHSRVPFRGMASLYGPPGRLEKLGSLLKVLIAGALA